MSSTTLKVSRRTLKELEEIRRRTGTKSLEETLRFILNERKARYLKQAFGADKGRISPFTEVDRGEDRS